MLQLLCNIFRDIYTLLKELLPFSCYFTYAAMADVVYAKLNFFELGYKSNYIIVFKFAIFSRIFFLICRYIANCQMS